MFDGGRMLINIAWRAIQDSFIHSEMLFSLCWTTSGSRQRIMLSLNLNHQMMILLEIVVNSSAVLHMQKAVPKSTSDREVVNLIRYLAGPLKPK